MIDAGGTDTYEVPTFESAFVPLSEGGAWGWSSAGLPSEHGGGIDGDGEAGIHAEAGATR